MLHSRPNKDGFIDPARITLADDMADNPKLPDPKPHIHFHEHGREGRHAHEHTHLVGDKHPHSTQT